MKKSTPKKLKSSNKILLLFSFISSVLIFGVFFLANSNHSLNVLSFATDNSFSLNAPIPSKYITPTRTFGTPTPTPSYCIDGVNTIQYSTPCGKNNFRYINYTCENKQSFKQGSKTSCKPVDVWLVYAQQDCKVCSLSPTPNQTISPSTAPAVTPTATPKITPTSTPTSSVYKFFSR